MAEEEKSKIIIDEDWKTQVQREKEEASKAAKEGGAAPKSAAAENPEGASFEALVSMLSLQVMIVLGAFPQEENEEARVNLGEGKYLIDMLMLLRDKTKGNLTPQEQGVLTESIANLQQLFVVRSQEQHAAALQNPGVDLGGGAG